MELLLYTSLLHICENEYNLIAKWLIEHGSKYINIWICYGETPLMIACEIKNIKHEEIVKLI